MRLFIGGREAIFPARWYFCPKGAARFPFAHGAEASPWIKGFETNFAWGEVTGGAIHFWPGTNPGYQALCYTGQDAWFADGQLPAHILDGPAPPFDPCCNRDPVVLSALLELGGAAIGPSRPSVGLELSGTAQTPLVLTEGLELSGTAQTPPVGAGGLELSGTAQTPPVGAGGLELAGAAPFKPAGTGGLQLGGMASVGQTSPSPSGDFPESCQYCPDGAAYQYKVRLSGLTNTISPLCTDCTSLNDTDLVMTYDGLCDWSSGRSLCGGGSRNPALNIGATTVVVAFLSALTEYTAPRAGWDCRTPLTLSLFTATGGCAGWPATITLTPV